MSGIVEGLLITDEDIAHMPGSDIPPPVPVDPAAAIENKVAPRVAEARLMVVTDQSTLNAVGDRLAINKALQKEAGDIFDPVIAAAHEAHKKAIAGKKKVTDPLTQEESILKLVAQGYVVEQRRLAAEAERIEQAVREATQRRLLAIAEEERKAREREINDRLEREHAEEVERAIEAAEANPGSWPEDVAAEVQAIIASPAPEPVHIPLDIPEMPAVAAPAVATPVLPKGMSVSDKVKVTVTNITLLCRAIAEGKAPANYVEANMKALNARARADGLAMSIPGVKAERDYTTGQRTR